MSEKILRYVRDELYFELRFLGTPLSAFVYQPEKRLVTAATDGETLFYSTEQVLRVFRENPLFLNRLYLHSVFHCLFSHLWLRGSRKPYLWGIACDIAVEYTIDHLNRPCTRRILGLVRTQVYEELEKEACGISAAVVYRFLKEQTPDRQKELFAEFFADDHVFWPKEEKLKEQEILLQKQWKKRSRQMEMEQKRKGMEKGEGEDVLSFQMKAERGRRSYREFLQKFMVMREEAHLSSDEFDLGFYMYGLSLYHNMPLIEPVESRETKKIRDFVIVVDTSYSTSGSLIRNFLKETFRILTMQDNFFRYSKLHLIQADEKVQSDLLIEDRKIRFEAGNPEELQTQKILEQKIEEFFSDFQIKGGGNTDFRPAFQYVDRLIEEDALKDLCGLLYFTDGQGIYPEKQPAYKTAFLFLEDYEEEKVPGWAIRMRLEKEEFE